jgi:hypothetical protein
VPSPDTKQIGQHLMAEVPNELVIGSGKVPSPRGGMCTPTLNVSSTTVGPEPWAKVEGPTCFGGCSEVCFDFKFPISKMDSESKAGDLAMITKLKPVGPPYSCSSQSYSPNRRTPDLFKWLPRCGPSPTCSRLSLITMPN